MAGAVTRQEDQFHTIQCAQGQIRRRNAPGGLDALGPDIFKPVQAVQAGATDNSEFPVGHGLAPQIKRLRAYAHSLQILQVLVTPSARR